jgi:GNAT superfamily N-acetyltransferase
LPEPIDVYVAASIARWRAMRHADQREVNQPGLYGLLACDSDPRMQLLVTDDQAHTGLTSLCAGARVATITVFVAARRCAESLAHDPAWRSSAATAMVCRDLTAIPRRTLPDGLTVRAVRRVAADPADGVALEDAIAAVALAAPRLDPEAVMLFLRSLPSQTHLLAAVDAGGCVRATSGWQLSGRHARVILVDTDPAWQGRGVGTAMTSAALHSARLRGAREATLDASAAGRSIYLRLGFELVSQTTRFVPATTPA